MAREFFSRFLRQDQAQTKLKRGVRRARRSATRGTDLRFESLEDRRMLAAGALDITFNPSGTLPPGTLLPSGQQGVVIGHFGGPTAQAEAFATVQLASGKILAAGRYQTTAAEATRNFAVWRYNVDGTLDTTFGNSDADGIAGMATVDATPLQPDFALDMAVDSLGRIVAVGRAGNGVDAAVVRLTAAGALDTSFSGDGIAITSSGTDEWQANSVAIDANDFIVVAGYVDKSIVGGDDFLVLRYTSGGALDTSFDGDGIATIGFNPGKDDQAYDVAIQVDGKIVVGGMGQIAASAVRDFALARLNTNGSLDNTFGTDFTGDLVPDGKLLSEVSTANDTIEAIALQNDGKIVAAGESSLGFAIIARYGSTGALDTSTFGVGNPLPGTLRINLDSSGPTTETSLGLAIQGDGKYVVAGRFVSSGDNRLMVARSTTSGILDTTFNGGPFAGGTITNLYSGTINENFRDVIVQSDGKILAVGQGNNSDLVLARYESGQLAADAGGPYAIDEPGASVVLAGAGVGSGTLTYVWDLDNDGIFSEAAGPGLYGDENGQTPTFNAALSDGPVAYPVTLGAPADLNGDLITDQTAEDTTTVIVANVAPTAGFANGGAVDEGSTGSVSFSGQFDPSPADTTAGFRYAYDFNNDGIWDVGDGSYGGSAAADSQVVPASYLADGAASLTVKGRILDDDGGFTDYTTTITVNDVAPTLVISGAANVDEGSAYTLNLSASDPGLDTITSWTIDWGDSVEVVAGNPGSVAHTYADGATGYVVSATATNEDGTFSSNSIAVTVDNVAPTLAISGAASVDEGAVFTLSLASSDVGTDTITSWTINWGDSVEVVAGNPTSVTHTYADGSASYTISATATDEDGSFASNSIGVTVDNIAPTLTISGVADIDEAATYTLNLSASDPGDDAIASWTINWGDGSEVVIGNPASVTHVYADGDASYSITATATDEDGAYAVLAAVAVLVHNVAPTLTISGNANSDEGSVYTLNLAASDPGNDTITSWTINWGDSSEVVSSNPASVTHTYADGAAAYTISATATDEDGTFIANSIVVTVDDVAPTLTISGAANVNEGSVYTLNLASSDPGNDTIASWTINWGDSSEVVTGNPASVNHTYADGANNYVISATATDEDGSYSANSISIAVDNVAQALTISGAVSVNEGSVYTLSLAASDPGTDTITSWTINWGDSVEVVTGNPGSVTHTYADGSASYTISATATDEDGTYSANTVAVTVDNVAPTANIGGPYAVGEGGTITLSATGSDAAGAADPLTFEWDLDNNGSYETSGASPVFSAAGLDGPTSRTINLRVSDGDGGVALATTTVSIVNVAPTADAGGPYLTFDDTPIVLSGSGSDPAGALDPLTLSWDLDGDGIFGESGGAATRGNETGANPTFNPTGLSGSYTVTLRVSDGDGGVTTDTATVNVLTEGVLLIDGTLYIVGTNSSDIVLVSRTGGTISVCASFNDDNPVLFNSANVTDIEVRMRGGHDIVLTTANVTQSMTIDGGAGNDLLTGGGGHNLITGGLGHDYLYGAGGDDVLLGGAGNDLLSGGTGDDVLVGGDGDDILLGGAGRDLIIGSQDNDLLEGGGDEDILIGGHTIHDNNLSALEAVMAIWKSSASFTARVNTLKGTGGLLQGGVAVFDDDDCDIISGGAGRDLVFGDTYLWDGAIDLIALQQAQDVLVAVN